MKSFLHALFTILIILFSMSIRTFSQQQVDVSAFEESYKGGFFRIDVGITPGIISFGEIDLENILPLYFDFVGGKRLSRRVAPYFLVYGHILLKETNAFTSFSQAGMNIGSNFYLRNPNTYLAPEVGLAILTLEENGGNSYSDNMGVKFALKWGRDFHIGGKMFIGTHIYLSYFIANNMDDDFLKGNGFFYGVNLSLKYGK